MVISFSFKLYFLNNARSSILVIFKIFCIIFFCYYLYTMQSHLSRYIYIYQILTYASFALYIISAIGLYDTAPQYILYIDIALKLFIGLFLIFRFNPLVKIQFNDFDKQIIFSAGIFILLSSTITTFILNKIQYKIKENVKKAVNKVNLL